jgi:hypothetical protein
VLRYYWRRAARIAPAFWVSLLATYLLVLLVRDHPEIPEAAGALPHYPAAACPGAPTPDACPSGVPTMQNWKQGVQLVTCQNGAEFYQHSFDAVVHRLLGCYTPCWPPCDETCVCPAMHCRGAVGAGSVPGAPPVRRRVRRTAVVAGAASVQAAAWPCACAVMPQVQCIAGRGRGQMQPPGAAIIWASIHHKKVQSAAALQGNQAAFWAIVPLLLVALRPKRAGFRRRVAAGAGAHSFEDFGGPAAACAAAAFSR